jgi:DNA polymerase III delta prime subunit
MSNMWCEKYRPIIIDDCILPDNLKVELNNYIKSTSFPNLLLYGNCGLGKTTVARCLANQRSADYLFINGSLEGNIDTLRTTIHDYISTISLSNQKKLIIIDEGDCISGATQMALRSFMEQWGETSIFIFTANYPNKIIEALQSRMAGVSFDVSKEDFSTLGKVLFKRVKNILDTENVRYDNKVLVKFLQYKFPDYRNTLISLESYYLKNGEIDEGILHIPDEGILGEILENLRRKKFDELKNLVFSSPSLNYQDIMMYIFENLDDLAESKEHPLILVILGKYQNTDRFVLNKRINIMAMLSEIICEVNLK